MADFEVTLAEASANIAGLLDRVVENNAIAIVSRGSQPNVAVLPESELMSVLETLHLLRSPANARRLFDALERVERQEYESYESASDFQSEVERELGQEEARTVTGA
ncbi:MAG: type II toxin-antitoxin system prevent-host-death family antitoxin [Cyanobacteria bacterium J06639_1]